MLEQKEAAQLHDEISSSGRLVLALSWLFPATYWAAAARPLPATRSMWLVWAQGAKPPGISINWTKPALYRLPV